MSKLHFNVSTGLKTVLGSELITDDEVAIFELVKNSFDANATRVTLFFDSDQVIVVDNGDGMSYDDIKEKWLFVAYSAKREENQSDDYREGIAKRKQYAGSKGVGRFSSDRLGATTTLQTRPKKDKAEPVHKVVVDWTLFDEDHLEKFQKIGVTYSEQESFELPKEIRRPKYGTVVSITGIKTSWNRDSLRDLKAGLAKLINPFGASADNFTIRIIAPDEEEADKKEIAKAEAKGLEPPANAVINGEVGNFIFDTLQQKTTFLDLRLTEGGTHVESRLTDRGELIYHIKEPNPYKLLASSEFKCQIYYLNRSAKQTFAIRMGVPSIHFGSIFLFRNGFRVFPVGERGNDWFGMDQRKQQGYARFLGSREVIGRIEVSGPSSHFQEASSRNTGLIETQAVQELRECFMELCLKRLEKYVVPVTYADKEDSSTEDISRLMTDPGRARVTAAVAKLVDSDEVELLDYSKNLISILSDRASDFESSLASLRAIAEKTEDRKLYKKIEAAEKRFAQLRKAEEEARRQADEERAAKEAAQTRAAEAEAKAETTAEQLDEERKRNLFLTSISSLDSETILSLHHQVTIYAVDAHLQIENFISSIQKRKTVPREEVLATLERLALLNSRIMGVAKFATKANFRLESEQIYADLGNYIEQYASGVATDFLAGRLSIQVDHDGREFVRKFKPIDVSVVVDNLIANAKKAGATHVNFEITRPNKNSIHIKVSDNGHGFHDMIDELPRVFEKGFTTTDGSGLGLYHIKQVLGEMNATIEALRNSDRGATFLIRISK